MSNIDHFIEEVSEEVRRDRLLLMMRRYGWIAILLAILIVGGAATNEFLKAQEAAKAEALGDGILGAFEANEPAARVEGLTGVTSESEGRIVAALHLAAEQQAAGDLAAAKSTLTAISADDTIAKRFRDLARFKTLLLAGDDTSHEERRSGFEALAIPGSGFRLLAEEQLALIEVETGATDDAILRLQAILNDNEASAGLRRRATQLIVALGGEIQTT